MGLIPESVKLYIGVKSEPMTACDAVERGAVRRFSQATMDDDPIYEGGDEAERLYGGGVAPPLFPQNMFRRDFGTPDLLTEKGLDQNFDGSSGVLGQELPEIVEFKGFGVLNGGSEVEFYRYARHGERVTVVSRYEDITERETSKGPIVLVIFVSEYTTDTGELLLRIRRTSLRRPVR